jgi:uncharacterized integral membrane protein
MIALLLFVIFGFAFGYFATQNTSLVTINFGYGSLQHIPMYALVLAALAVGMLFATIFYIVKSFSFQLISNRLSKELHEVKKENIELVKVNHKLELANTKLLAKTGEESDTDSL